MWSPTLDPTRRLISDLDRPKNHRVVLVGAPPPPPAPADVVDHDVEGDDDREIDRCQIDASRLPELETTTVPNRVDGSRPVRDHPSMRWIVVASSVPSPSSVDATRASRAGRHDGEDDRPPASSMAPTQPIFEFPGRMTMLGSMRWVDLGRSSSRHRRRRRRHPFLHERGARAVIVAVPRRSRANIESLRSSVARAGHGRVERRWWDFAVPRHYVTVDVDWHPERRRCRYPRAQVGPSNYPVVDPIH